MKKMNLILLTMVLLFGCGKEDTGNDLFCNVENPIEDIAWLSRVVEIHSGEASNKIEIYQCLYKDTEGFLIDWCVNCPDGLTQFFSCDSVVVCEFGGIMGSATCPDFDKETLSKELLWNN